MTEKCSTIEDGAIAFEWYKSRHSVAVVTVDPYSVTWSGIVDDRQYSGRLDLPEKARKLIAAVLREGGNNE